VKREGILNLKKSVLGWGDGEERNRVGGGKGTSGVNNTGEKFSKKRRVDEPGEVRGGGKRKKD